MNETLESVVAVILNKHLQSSKGQDFEDFSQIESGESRKQTAP